MFPPILSVILTIAFFTLPSQEHLDMLPMPLQIAMLFLIPYLVFKVWPLQPANYRFQRRSLEQSEGEAYGGSETENREPTVGEIHTSLLYSHDLRNINNPNNPNNPMYNDLHK